MCLSLALFPDLAHCLHPLVPHLQLVMFVSGQGVASALALLQCSSDVPNLSPRLRTDVRIYFKVRALAGIVSNLWAVLIGDGNHLDPWCASIGSGSVNSSF